MTSFDQQQLRELDLEYERLSETMQALSKAKHTESLAPQEHLRVSRQIQEAQQEREAIAKQRESLVRKLDNERLYRALFPVKP